MPSLFSRLLGLLGLGAAVLVALVVLTGGSSGTGSSATGTDGCAPAGSTVNVAHTPVAAGDPCVEEEAESVGWSYQVMSTDRSDAEPWVGSRAQQWLAAGGVAAAAAAVGVVRRRMRA
jgi:hypothetical protein